MADVAQKLANELRCDIFEIAEIVFIIDHKKLDIRRGKLEEIEHLSMYMTDEQIDSLLALVKSMTDEKRKQDELKQRKSIEEMK